MNRVEILQKIYLSKIALTILYGLPFGLLTFLFEPKHNKSTIPLHIFSGLLFGLLMTFSQRKRLKKTLKIAADNKQSKNKKFNLYLKHADIPKTESERQELIIYMQKIENSQKAMNKNYYPKKYSKLMSYGILLLVFIFTFSLKPHWLLVLYPVIAAIGIYGEQRNRLLMQRINVMKAKLGA